jgi:hypothetical protein
MARKTRLTPYGEQIVEVFDLDESGSEFTSYRSTPSMAANDGLPSDDPAPLFSPIRPKNPSGRVSGKLGTERLSRLESSRRVFWL